MGVHETSTVGGTTPPVGEIKTFLKSASHFRLDDNSITNPEIAAHLSVSNFDQSFGSRSEASEYFYRGNTFVGLRWDQNRVSICSKHLDIQVRMQQLGTRITIDPDKPADQMVDWTVDLSSGKADASQEFRQLRDDIAKYIGNNAGELIRDGSTHFATLLLSHLAHNRQVAPQNSRNVLKPS